MDVIAIAIKKPVTVAVGVLLVLMFGLLGLGAIPIQLTPTVDRPVLTVQTSWPGRSPEEIADDITKEQEERLKSVNNLKSMRSTSREGQAVITLEFYVGTEMGEAKQDVADALRQVPEYPNEVDEPTVRESAFESEGAIAWLILDIDPDERHRFPEFEISTLFHGVDQEVKPILERIDGVGRVRVIGGREREARVLLDPVRMAQRGLTYQQVIGALRNENRDISGGTIAEGKRDYRIRVVGQFESAEDILDTIVAYRARQGDERGAAMPVYIRDLGTVEIGFDKARGFLRNKGQPSLAMSVNRRAGSNVITVMADLRERLDEVRADILPKLHPEVGPYLRLQQVYDETVYISSAIDLVKRNLWLGGSLAVLALLLFLRSWRTTIVVAMAIPISVMGTFLIMLVTGRTLNVISLAGLAFATGMVVDNAVVVLENIDRRRTMGDGSGLAVYRGAKEVWGAVLAATLTTVAVFVPILTIQEEAGQLFFDLTLALAASVTLSLIVAITVIPSAAHILFKNAARDEDWHRHPIKNLFGLAPALRRLVDRVGEVMFWLMTGWRGWSLRPLIIVSLTGLSIFGALKLAPPLDYLPSGNRNLVFGGLSIPPGLSVDERLQYAKRIENDVRPYMEVEGSDPAALAALAPIEPVWGDGPALEPVGVKNLFIGSFGGGMFIGASSQDPDVVIPVGTLISGAMRKIPSAQGGAAQSSIFGRGANSGNTISIEVSGPSLERVKVAAERIQSLAGGIYGFDKIRAQPSNFNIEQLEFQIRLTDAGRELGLTTSDVGTAVRALFDGAFVGDYLFEGRKIDLVVLPEGGRLEYKEKLESIPIVTPSGRVVPIDSLVEMHLTTAAQEIQRIEELPAVSLRITPPTGAAIESLMDEIRSSIIEPTRQAGLIDASMRVRLEGSAAKLDEVKAALFGASNDQGLMKAGGAPLWRPTLTICAIGLLLAGFVVSLLGAKRAISPRRDTARLAYGATGALCLSVILASILLLAANEPQLVGARFVWALVVTFLVMAALFESFLFPFVIMFSVPLAMVGGFAALRLVHDWTAANPTIAPQQFDILTMIGFVILIGVVVNNAILIVQQSLNFMNPARVPGLELEKGLEPLRAVSEAVKTRCRPIFTTTCTTIGGGLPLVLAPGAGSEMYRGLGAVVVGGLVVSSFFTLIMVPMLFSLVLQMRDGVRAIFERVESSDSGSSGLEQRVPARRREPAPLRERQPEPDLEPVVIRGIGRSPA